MGRGEYSVTNSVVREQTYASLNNSQIFQERTLNREMNPRGITVRESRDSNEHPNSVAIVLGLDVTGSMGSVPSFLVKQGLTKCVSSIIQGGEPDPQLLFLGIGDHECDSAPLQVGQFESSDELLDKWLTSTFLEGGGGGNAGESYLLAWYFAAMHTDIDCFNKRGKKGFVFTIGDEPTLLSLPVQSIVSIMGASQANFMTAAQLFEAASEHYNVFHIHLKETGSGRRQATIDGWKQLIGQNLLLAEHSTDIAKIITDTVLAHHTEESSNTTSSHEGTSHEEDML